MIWWMVNGPNTRDPFKRVVDAAAMIPSTVAVTFATAAAAVSWLGAAAVLTITPPLPPLPLRPAASLS